MPRKVGYQLDLEGWLRFDSKNVPTTDRSKIQNLVMIASAKAVNLSLQKLKWVPACVKRREDRRSTIGQICRVERNSRCTFATKRDIPRIAGRSSAIEATNRRDDEKFKKPNKRTL